MKIIDAHVHLFETIKGCGGQGGMSPLGAGWVEYDTGERRQRFPAELGDVGVTAESFLSFMDAHGIEKAVVMQGPSYGYQNQYLSKVQERYPDRFLAAAFVDPEISRFDDVLDNLTGSLKLRFFKLELSVTAGTTGSHVRLNTFDSPNLKKLFDKAQDMRSTVALDLGGPQESSYQVDRVAELAKSYPALRIVICHLVSPSRADEAGLRKNLAKLALPNVWFDVASLPGILEDPIPYDTCRRYLKLGLEIAGAGRLIWGTDAPGSLLKQDYDTLLRFLIEENGDFTEEEKRLILYRNAFDAYPLK